MWAKMTIDRIWCEALSSRQETLRGPGRSDGQVTQNTPQNDPFARHQLHDSNLDHPISLYGMSSDCLGKFSSWF